MTYSNFQFAKPITFDRHSASRALTRYIVFPAGDNRTAIIMTLDVPFEEVPRYMRNDWQVTSCDSEEEFVSRFGKPLYDLIVAEYAKVEDKDAAKRELGVKLAAIIHQIPAAIASEIESSTLVDPEAVWKAKFAFIQNLHRLNNIKDHMYGMMGAEEAAGYYSKEVEQEFEAFLTVNGQYVLHILAAINPLYEKHGHNTTIQMDFEVPIMSEQPDAMQMRRHNRAHSSAGVKTFKQMLEVFLERVRLVREEESLATISALMVAHTMCHEAIRGFKLFEQE